MSQVTKEKYQAHTVISGPQLLQSKSADSLRNLICVAKILSILVQVLVAR